MENCVLIPAEKNAHKYWKKYLKTFWPPSDCTTKNLEKSKKMEAQKRYQKKREILIENRT